MKRAITGSNARGNLEQKIGVPSEFAFQGLEETRIGISNAQ